MTKRRYIKQLYRVSIKKTITFMPKLFLSAIVSAIVVGIAVFLMMHFFSKNDEKMKIALVMQDESPTMKMAIRYVESNVPYKFVYYTDSDAMQAIVDKKVIAILYVRGENIFESMDLTEEDVSVVFADDGQRLTKLFENMINAGLSDYMAFDAAARIAGRVYDMDWDTNEAMQIDLIMYLIERNRNYERIIYSDSGDVPMSYFYIASGIALIVMFSSVFVTGALLDNNKNFIHSLRQLGITITDIFGARYMGMYIIYILTGAIAFVIYSMYFGSGFDILCLASFVLATFMSLSVVFIINEIVGNSLLGSVVTLLGVSIMMFLSGNLLPLSMLPKEFESISEAVVTRWITRAYGQALYGSVSGSCMMVCIIIELALMGGLYVINVVKGR